MILGRFRDHLPRITLVLPGTEDPLSVEFIVDTGFEGEMTLPGALLRRLDAQPLFLSLRRLADGTERECPVHRIPLDWNEEARTVEVLVLENNPLIGTLLLEGGRLDIEMEEGGEVVIELPG